MGLIMTKIGDKMYQNTVDFELNLTILYGYSNKGQPKYVFSLNRHPHLGRNNENLVSCKKEV